MEFVLLGIGAILGLVAFGCSIFVVVKMFQNEKTGLGVASAIGMLICGFGYILTLVFGWQNKKAWALEKVMPIYTACLVLAIIFYGAGYAILLPKMMDEIKNQQMQQGGFPQGSFQMPSIENGN